MNRLYLVACGLILVKSVLGSQALVPQNKIPSVQLETGGVKTLYYEMSESASFKVKGPCVVTFYMRSAPQDTSKVRFLVNGTAIDSFRLEQRASHKSKLEGGKEVTRAQKFSRELGAGEHRIELQSSKTVYIKCEHRRRFPAYAIVPSEHAGGIVLRNEGKDMGYYISTASDPVKFSIYGEGDITIYTRMIYTKEKLGTQHYSLEISMDDGAPVLYEFETTPSKVSSFPNSPELRPSSGGSVKLKIGKGLHYVKIVSRGSNTALIRISAPEALIRGSGAKKK